MDTDTTTETTATESTAAESTTESTATEPTGIFSEGFTFREGWADSLEGDAFDETRATLAQYKDLPTLAKALVDNKRAATARTDGMVKLPGADSTPEEIAAFHKALGVPESPDKYQIKTPENLPEGIEFKPETLTQFAEFAHKVGISNEVANQLIAFQAQMESAEMALYQQQQQEALEAETKQLKQEWGNQFERKMMLANRAAQTFGLPSDHPALQSADVVKAFAKAAASISEDSLVPGDKLGGGLSPGNEAKDILNNPDNPLHKAYHDTTHPDHEGAVATYMQKMKEQVERERR